MASSRMLLLFCKNSNFEPSPERTVGTYSKYSSIDDKMDDLHFFATLSNLELEEQLMTITRS